MFEKSVSRVQPPIYVVVEMIGPVRVVFLTQLDIKAGIELSSEGGFSL